MSVLQTWNATEPVPETVRRLLPVALRQLEQETRPADSTVLTVTLDRLLGWIQRYGLMPVHPDPDRHAADVRAMTVDYRVALVDLPADLMTRAVEQTIARCSSENTTVRSPPIGLRSRPSRPGR